MCELFHHRNFWFDIDRNGTPVAHVEKQKVDGEFMRKLLTGPWLKASKQIKRR
jgi:hypothetical protein